MQGGKRADTHKEQTSHVDGHGWTCWHCADAENIIIPEGFRGSCTSKVAKLLGWLDGVCVNKSCNQLFNKSPPLPSVPYHNALSPRQSFQSCIWKNYFQTFIAFHFVVHFFVRFPVDLGGTIPRDGVFLPSEWWDSVSRLTQEAPIPDPNTVIRPGSPPK